MDSQRAFPRSDLELANEETNSTIQRRISLYRGALLLIATAALFTNDVTTALLLDGLAYLSELSVVISLPLGLTEGIAVVLTGVFGYPGMKNRNLLLAVGNVRLRIGDLASSITTAFTPLALPSVARDSGAPIARARPPRHRQPSSVCWTPLGWHVRACRTALALGPGIQATIDRCRHCCRPASLHLI